MRKAFSKGAPAKRGFIRATLAPVDSKREPTFGALDVVLIVALVSGLLAVARHLLAR